MDPGGQPLQIAVQRDCPGATLYEVEIQLIDTWADLVATAGVQRVAIEAMTMPVLTWERLKAAAPKDGRSRRSRSR